MPKNTLEKMSLPIRTAITVGASLLFAFIICIIISAVAFLSDDPTKNLTLYGEIAFCITMLFCGFLGARIASDKRFASGVIASGIMLLIVITASIVFGGESFVKELILALLGAFIASVGAAIGSREKKRRRKR
ncbi:MAG: hypothetical protein IJA60_06610 [Clostridia bacterium]|nr:hypothetical protein [Clostridia bacterium]